MSNSAGSELCRALILRLSELEAERARVLRHLSHELKTPLAALREGAALLQEELIGPLNENQREVVGILEQNTHTLQRQIEELLNYHAAVLDSSHLQRRRVRLRELLDSVVEAQQLPLQAQRVTVRVECRCEHAQLDPDKMRVALGNLLSNAITFSPPGSEIRLVAGLGGLNDRALCIDCIDQGPGVAAEDAAHIFDPFVQGRRRPLPERHGKVGSGVGLSIVREVAMVQGGQVSLVPSAHGAHFRMELPYEE